MITRRAFLTDPGQMRHEDGIGIGILIRQLNHQPSDIPPDRGSTEKQPGARNVTVAQNIQLRAAVASLRRRSGNEQG
jgi:hypothetical protein